MKTKGVTTNSSRCCPALSLLFFLVAGCADEPGCREDYFTPETVQDLAAVNKPEALLAASVFAQWDHVREKNHDVDLPKVHDLRQAALRLAPNDEMVLAFLSSTCSVSKSEDESVACGRDLATRLKNLDPENGFYSANLARYQFSEGDVDAALGSYQRAAAAKTFASGWGKQVYKLSLALQDVLGVTESCSSELAAGAASTNLPAFEGFTENCRAQSDDARWREACLNMGRKMETESLTLMTRMIGFPLQRIVHEAMGDEESLTAVDARQAQLRKLVVEQGKMHECRWEDPEWIHQWLVSMRDYDEMETLRRMSKTTREC